MYTMIKSTALCTLLMSTLLLTATAHAAKRDSIDDVLRTLDKVVLVIAQASTATDKLADQITNEFSVVARLERDLLDGRDPGDVADELGKAASRVSSVERHVADMDHSLDVSGDQLDGLGTRAKQLHDRTVVAKIRDAMNMLDDAHAKVGDLKLDIATVRAEIKRVMTMTRP